MTKKNYSPDLLYHYTTMETFFAIIDNIRNSQISFRATNHNYLNDYSENKIISEVFKEIVYEKESTNKNKYKRKLSEKDELFWEHFVLNNNQRDLYVTSFSEHKDELPMWNAYADSSTGIALGIDFSMLPEKGNSEPLKGNSICGSCQYERSELRKHLLKHFDLYYNHIAANFTEGGVKINFSKSIFQKHYKFYYEKEWRVVTKCDKDDSLMKYTAINGVIKPFIEWNIDKIALKKVIIGPCANSEINYSSIKKLLKQKGFIVLPNNNKDMPKAFEIQILESECPFRNI